MRTMPDCVHFYERAAREVPVSEFTDRVWALDQLTMLNSRAWLGEEANKQP